MEMQKTYNPKDFEDRIYADWEQSGYFRAEVDENKVPFTIMMPPPNITGHLHMGHAMDATMQDTLIRFKRMQGYAALWLPGCDFRYSENIWFAISTILLLSIFSPIPRLGHPPFQGYRCHVAIMWQCHNFNTQSYRLFLYYYR